MAKDYTALRNEALANFEPLLNLLNIDWKKVGEYEYDFKNPTRNDRNFGACRFNVLKNTGSDFAAPEIHSEDYLVLGPTFSKEDFAPISAEGHEAGKSGFDVIGLIQRLNKLSSYREAADLLKRYLLILNSRGELGETNEVIKRREEELAKKRLYLIKKASQVWSYCRPIKGTIGEKYFYNRAIENTIEEPNVLFHPKVKSKELNKFLPCIILKVATAPDQELTALHRIYLDETGAKKAPLEDPKRALGPVKGSGVWLGKPGPKLYVAEGPENALSLREMGAEFVVSAVFGNNMASIAIPDYVEIIILAGDNDGPGKKNVARAAKAFAVEQRKVCKVIFPPNQDDWNSALMREKGRL